MNLKKFKYVNVDVLIGKDTRLTGDLVSESAMKIDGTVLGNIQTSKEVIISDGAFVEGDINAGALIIAGKLNGNAVVSDQLVVKSTGALEGNIETGSLVIEEGGVFIGMNHAPRKEVMPEETTESSEMNTEV